MLPKKEIIRIQKLDNTNKTTVKTENMPTFVFRFKNSILQE